MSCMMMSPESLAAIANAAEAALNNGFDYMGFDVPHDLCNAVRGMMVCGSYDAHMIYKKLYSLNSAAYAGRYMAGCAEEAPEIDLVRYTIHHPPEYADHRHAVRPWHYHLAKLLDFWLYQTCEDITAHDSFRVGMYEFRNALLGFIVECSPEYAAAPGWDRF